MKINRVISLVIIMGFVMGIISVVAAPPSSTVAKMPWTTQVLDDNEPLIRNLSTAFVGKNQIPMLSYTRMGSDRFYQAHLETKAVSGNCGQDEGWFCSQWSPIGLAAGSVSNMAAYLSDMDTFTVYWVYGTTANTLRGAKIVLQDDMTFVSDSWEDLIDIEKFGDLLVSAPSLQVVEGWYRVAVTIRSDEATPTYKLVYLHKTTTPNTSCVLSGMSLYQCDVIEEASGYNSIGEPSLQVAPDGTVGIAYFRAGAIRYAYPFTSTSWMRPSNCGPGSPKTWRCININGLELDQIARKTALAIG